MVHERDNLMSLLRAGKVTLDDVDYFVEDWHRSDSREPLHEYLGMTWSEYVKFVKDPKSILDNL